MRKGIVFTDAHLSVKESFHPAYLLVKKFAVDFGPDFVADLGDTLDLDYFASFNKEKVSILGDCDWEGDVDMLNAELDWWQGVTKEYIWMQGNHDERAERIAEIIPAFRQTLDYERRFRIKERGIKYGRLVDGAKKIGKLHLIHGWYTPKYHTYKHLEMLSGNVVYGHVHKFQTHSKTLLAKHEEVQAWSLGCLCDKQPEYTKGRPTGWQHGFAVVYMDDAGNFSLYPVNIINNRFIFGGKEWRTGS